MSRRRPVRKSEPLFFGIGSLEVLPNLNIGVLAVCCREGQSPLEHLASFALFICDYLQTRIHMLWKEA